LQSSDLWLKPQRSQISMAIAWDPYKTSLLVYALQIKGRLESNINVWFQLLYLRNETGRPRYFHNRIIMSCVLISTFIFCEGFIYSQDLSAYFAATK
jgi:hypothetical protein